LGDDDLLRACGLLRPSGRCGIINWGSPPPHAAQPAAAEPSAPAPAEAVIARRIDQVDLAALASCDDPVALLGILGDAACGWAFTDTGVEAVGVLGPAADALAAVADALAAAPGAAWWWEGVDRDIQRWVTWSWGPPGPPSLGAAGDGLRRSARDEAARTEAQAADDSIPFPPGPGDPHRSGMWWSAPRAAGVIGTTRAVGPLPAAALAADEDNACLEAAEVWELTVDPAARVYEVDGPDAWRALVEGGPRDVTLSRRDDWYRWTGWAGRWLLPDWAKLAVEWDGVHVRAAAYLETAYRALPIADGAATCLAGWGPDETVWIGPRACRSARLVARVDAGEVSRLLDQHDLVRRLRARGD
jgi:hypothetical protein